MKERFDCFNGLYFDNLLPKIEFRLSAARATLGCFVHPRSAMAKPLDCHIRITSRIDFEEPVLEDIVIHEMIHYWIWFNRMKDSSTHGHIFKAKMNQINRQSNRHISVRHTTSKAEAESDVRRRHNIICVTRWDNGVSGLTVCARTQLFNIYRLFDKEPRVKSMDWYWSSDPCFNSFPVYRTAKARIVPEAELKVLLTKCVKCICDGSIFKVDTSFTK